MRCLVTGAAGFIGSHLLSQLLQNDHSVTILLRPNTNLWRIRILLPQAKIIVSDLSCITEMTAQIVEARPEIVFNLAWAGGSSGRYQNDITQIENNLPGALNLLQIASDAGVRRWVGIGSAFEYGNLRGVLTETSLPKPNTMYAISKYSLCLATAKMCALLGVEYLWVRPFATYGYGDDPRGLIPFVTKMLLQGECPALTAGEQEWDYLHVEDAAQALMQLAFTQNAQGVYNLASGKVQTVRNLVERLRDQINPNLSLGFGEIPYHSDQIMNLRADISKLSATTSWVPKIALEEGLKRVISEFSADGLAALRQP